MKIKMFFVILVLFTNNCWATLTSLEFNKKAQNYIKDIERLRVDVERAIKLVEECDKTPYTVGDNVSENVEKAYKKIRSAIIGN